MILTSCWRDEWLSEKICQSAMYTVKRFINIRHQIKPDGVGRSKPPVKSCYLKVKIRSVCIPWAHTSWEIAQGIPNCTPSQLRLAILSRRSVNWAHLYVDISGLTGSTYVVTLQTLVAVIYWVLTACLEIDICYAYRGLLLFFHWNVIGKGVFFGPHLWIRISRVREDVTCLKPCKWCSQIWSWDMATSNFLSFDCVILQLSIYIYK